MEAKPFGLLASYLDELFAAAGDTDQAGISNLLRPDSRYVSQLPVGSVSSLTLPDYGARHAGSSDRSQAGYGLFFMATGSGLGSPCDVRLQSAEMGGWETRFIHDEGASSGRFRRHASHLKGMYAGEIRIIGDRADR